MRDTMVRYGRAGEESEVVTAITEYFKVPAEAGFLKHRRRITAHSFRPTHFKDVLGIES